LKSGEAKEIVFTITDAASTSVDVSSATVTFVMKRVGGGATSISKADTSFNKTNAGNGVISCVLTSTDTQLPGRYVGELKINFNTNNVDKSRDIDILINEAVTS